MFIVFILCILFESMIKRHQHFFRRERSVDLGRAIAEGLDSVADREIGSDAVHQRGFADRF